MIRIVGGMQFSNNRLGFIIKNDVDGKIVGADLGESHPDDMPFPSYTFTHEQLLILKEMIEGELKELE